MCRSLPRLDEKEYYEEKKQDKLRKTSLVRIICDNADYIDSID